MNHRTLLPLLLALALLPACYSQSTSGQGDAGTSTDTDVDTDSGTDVALEPGDITSISGTSADDVWAVTDNGFALRYDGETWAVDKVADVRFSGVWAGALDLVLAVSDGWPDGYPATETARIHRFDGAAWQVDFEHADIRLADVWGSGPDQVFAVGRRDFDSSGVILAFDGSEWTEAPVDAPRLMGTWGSSSNDVWAVGEHSALWFDGSSWFHHDEVSAEGPLFSVWCAGPDQVFAVGDETVLFYNGLDWEETSFGPWGLGLQFIDIWGVEHDDVFMLGVVTLLIGAGSGMLFHWDSEEWSEVDHEGVSFYSPEAVWGASSDEIYVAADGQILHYDGTGWEVSWAPSS